MSVRLSISSSVRIEQPGSHWMDFLEIWRLRIFRKSVPENLISITYKTGISGSLHEDLCTFLIISHWLLFRIRNVSDKLLKIIKTHILYSITFFPPSEFRAIYKIMWKNIVQPDSPQTTIWRIRFACQTTKATDTHSESVMLLFHGSSGYANVQRWYVTCIYFAFLAWI